MSAEQRALSQQTMCEDEASLLARLAEWEQAEEAADAAAGKGAPAKAKPRRQALPAQLRRVEHQHEPEDAACPAPGCG